jgi:hypothetical protein
LVGFSKVVWSAAHNQSTLEITLATTTQLVATVPAQLINPPGSADIFVTNLDQDGNTAAVANSIRLVVTSGEPSATISISLSRDIAGSPDLTLTILSNNFILYNGHWQNLLLWMQDGVDTPLQANFVGVAATFIQSLIA